MKREARTLVRTLVLLVVGGLCLGVGFWVARSVPISWLGTRVDERTTLSILRSEALQFLVTRRTATQIVIEHEESNLLGEWRGVLWATVHWRWGVDLKKIQAQDVHRQGEQILCRLPEPELLDFSVEPETMGFMSKSTVVPKLLDLMRGDWQRRILEMQLRERAMKFAKDRNLCPTRRELIAQLNDAAAAIQVATGLQIRFE